MNSIQYFFWMANEAVRSLWVERPITTAWALVFILCIAHTFFIKKKRFGLTPGLSLLTFVFPILILLWGTIFRHKSGMPIGVSNWVEGIGLLLFIGHIGFVGYQVYRMPSYTGFVTMISLMGLWLSFVSYFSAAMSVAGDWL